MIDLLVALVVLPILASASITFAGWLRERTGWPMAVLALLGQTALAATVTVGVLERGRASHTIGGFVPPYGIEFVADGLSVPFVVLVAGASLAVLAYARETGPHSNPFYALYLLLVAGLTGVCVTGDVFTLYVFLEISGLAAYGLVASASGGDAALAALKYLLVGTVGATFYLLGVGYLYAATGTLNMAALAATLSAESTLTVVAFGCVVLGLAVKMALFPLHVWKPDAYEHAPWAVSVLLAALVSTVAGYALIRLTYGVFTVQFFAANPLVDEVLIAGACVSVLAGGILAFRQQSVSRLFAYSSITQFGLATLGIALGTVPAVVGAVVQLLGHGVMKGGLFAAAGVIETRTRASTVDAYAGRSEDAPFASGALAVIACGLVGIPPTVGFVAKWYLAVGALEADSLFVFGVVLASTFLSLTYFGRLVQRLYVDAPEQTPELERISTGMSGVVIGAAAATVLLGLFGFALASFAQPAVSNILHP